MSKYYVVKIKAGYGSTDVIVSRHKTQISAFKRLKTETKKVKEPEGNFKAVKDTDFYDFE